MDYLISLDFWRLRDFYVYSTKILYICGQHFFPWCDFSISSVLMCFKAIPVCHIDVTEFNGPAKYNRKAQCAILGIWWFSNHSLLEIESGMGIFYCAPLWLGLLAAELMRGGIAVLIFNWPCGFKQWAFVWLFVSSKNG